MARVLIAWELGGGGGHVEILLPVIERLLADGHDVSVAVRDLAVAARRLRRQRVRLLQAPYWPGLSSLPPALSYAETMMRVGYQDAGIVRALLAGWLGLIELTRCERLVAEHAPGALLAARVAAVPVAVLGTGFSLPPPEEPMPSLPMPSAAPLARLLDAERRVLAAVDAALSRHGGEPLRCLADLFDRERSFLCTVEELDHYGAREGVDYRGAMTRSDATDEPVWPAGGGEPVFAYMHPGYGHFPAMVEQLAALRQPTLVVAPGIPDDALSGLQRASLKVVNRAVDLTRVADRCRVVITHGGHGILATVLGLGVAPILAPANVEQGVVALRLTQQGMAVLAGGEPAHYRYAPAIERVLGDRAPWRGAAVFAARHPPSAAARRRAALQAAVAAALSL